MFEPLFLAADPGQRFCIHHPPHGHSVRGAVLYVHPFAEEMNKARRMAAMGSRALAAQGFAVLQIDLLGCGDSSGDFGDATWSHWIDDVLLGAGWLQARYDAPLWLWGLRAGALLAAAAARRLPDAPNLLLWQPTTQGRQVLQQFLRLKAAADLAGGGKGIVEGLRQALQSGHAVEVAGYTLAPALAAPLEACALGAAVPSERVVWLETASRPDADLLPASRSVIDAWRGSGLEVEARVVQGPAFWQTTEIEDAPALVAATTGPWLFDRVPA